MVYGKVFEVLLIFYPLNNQWGKPENIMCMKNRISKAHYEVKETTWSCIQLIYVVYLLHVTNYKFLLWIISK